MHAGEGGSNATADTPLAKKRKRPTIDAANPGPTCKKRRLRLTLITSRLSQPFAVPATHIADRGRSRIAAWAKQQKKAPWGRALLRKAATLNHATRRGFVQSPNMAPSAGLEMLLRRKGVEMARLAWLRGSLATVNSARPVDCSLQYAPTYRQQQQQEEAEGDKQKSHARTDRIVTSSTATAPKPPSKITATAVDAAGTTVKRVVESPNFKYSCYAPSPPSPLGQSSHEAEGLKEEVEQGKHCPDGAEDEKAVGTSATTEGGRDEQGRSEDDMHREESAYFDSLIFGIATPPLAAVVDSPALSSTSVFKSDYDRLDDLASAGSDIDGWASSVPTSPAYPASLSATSITSPLTDYGDATTGALADHRVLDSPSPTLFFDLLLDPSATDGSDAPSLPAVPPPDRRHPSASKRPPRPKGWNPNFASAYPPSSPNPDPPDSPEQRKWEAALT